MSNSDPSGSDSDSKEIDSDSSSDETETPNNGGETEEIPEYEKQRIKRMEQNKAMMEALGLSKIASSLFGSVPDNNSKTKKIGKKGKRKVNEVDEDYKPEGEEEGDDYDDDDSSRVSIKKGSKMKATLKNKDVDQKGSSDKDFGEDVDALKKLSCEFKRTVYNALRFLRPDAGAIALSLQDSSGFLNGNLGIVEDNKGNKKRKKPINSRVQMTEDELIVHFFQFDEAGKGNINVRDLRKIAAAHDFTWSDTEMANMITFFDTDGDGKLNLDEFRKIVVRCNMLHEPSKQL